MKILFHLGHPAHFHLFKNVIKHLKEKENEIFIVIKKKDILENLLNESEFDYVNILHQGRKNSKVGILIGTLKQTLKLLFFCLKKKPELLIGSTPGIAHVGKLINKPSINLSEDDVEVVKLSAIITFPFSTVILSPVSCNNGRWNHKTIKYNSYHELAYLHPNHFTPEIQIVQKYILTNKPFFLLRFSSLNAYHDKGIEGINDDIALQIIEKLKKSGRVIISSEKILSSELEKYRLNINSLDMHHLLAYAKLFIGDSQTMAAEAAVLGTPFIRINDFVGKLGYLKELEEDFGMGTGIKPVNINNVFDRINYYLNIENIEEKWELRRKKLLEEKIDFTQYLISFIENNY